MDVPAVRVDVTGAASLAVDAPALLPYDLAGKAVLVHTGFDRHWGTEAYGRDNRSSRLPQSTCSSAKVPRSSASTRSTSTIQRT